MEPFVDHIGIVASLDRVNVDTDMIIPKQFLRKIERTGFGQHLFHELRFTDYEGTVENPDFILNKPRLRTSSILLARDNFGCGSSREHAPWALYEYGFRVIIAPSFADIFYNNCIKNGILPAKLKPEEIDILFEQANDEDDPIKVTADLKSQNVTGPDGHTYEFQINPFAKECLLMGLDQIGWTEQFNEQIDAYENRSKEERPWLA